MSEYITKTYGPGDIAALPPTIGATSRKPTIGAEDVGHPIKQAFPFHQQAAPGAVRVKAAGLKLPAAGLGALGKPIKPIVPAGIRQRYGLLGLGSENGNGETPAWVLPVGLGLVLGGLYVYFNKQKEGPIFQNVDEPACNGCGL